MLGFVKSIKVDFKKFKCYHYKIVDKKGLRTIC